MLLSSFRLEQLQEHSICMSINRERYEYMCKNFNACGLNYPRLFRGVRWNGGSNTGCVLSHLAIVMMARCLNYDYVVIYEDDAYPRQDIIKFWEDIRLYIPDNCGILKLGSSSFRGDIVNINKHVCKIKNGTAFGSHAYIIQKDCYDIYINTLMEINIPDGAMDFKYYKNCKLKPYCLNANSQLFIQKNIGIDNIIANKGGQRYWYPSSVQKYGITSGKPPFGFKPYLIPFEEECKYLKNMVVIKNSKWIKGKKSAIIEGDLIYTRDESGKIVKNSQIEWDDGKISTFRDDGIKNDTHFYTIVN